MSLSLSTGLRACVRLSVLCVHVCTCACARARLCVRACARALARAASALACARLPSAPRASRPALEPTSRSKCYLALPSALLTHVCASGNQKTRIESPACASGFARGVKARLAGLWFGVLYSPCRRPSLFSVSEAFSSLCASGLVWPLVPASLPGASRARGQRPCLSPGIASRTALRRLLLRVSVHSSVSCVSVHLSPCVPVHLSDKAAGQRSCLSSFCA